MVDKLKQIDLTGGRELMDLKSVGVQNRRKDCLACYLRNGLSDFNVFLSVRSKGSKLFCVLGFFVSIELLIVFLRFFL